MESGGLEKKPAGLSARLYSHRTATVCTLAGPTGVRRGGGEENAQRSLEPADRPGDFEVPGMKVALHLTGPRQPHDFLGGSQGGRQ